MLIAEGASLVISYRTNRERAQRFEGEATVVQADLTSELERQNLLNCTRNLYAVVVLCGNPARVPDPKRLTEVLHESHEINYMGPILLAREAADRMKASGTPGAIVLVSTMQANALFAGSTAYAAQKAALQHAARILAKECRNSSLRVNVVSPGVTAAGMAEASIASGKYDRYIQEGIIPRFGRAEDIARAVRFFLEPDNYVTGQVLCVDGGMTL
jgi:NAD(P)-dependent dehydrogenase (short-subunit alcohol dehydrogenase family)